MVRARVKNGRLVVDEPTELPDGTVVEVVLDDEGDDLDESERKALHSAIDRAWVEVKEGRTRPVEALLEELRARR